MLDDQNSGFAGHKRLRVVKKRVEETILSRRLRVRMAVPLAEPTAKSQRVSR